MSARDDLITALEGGEPEHTPLSAYDFFFTDSDGPALRALLDAGLILTNHQPSVTLVRHGVEEESEDAVEDGVPKHVQRWKTPVGTVRKAWVQGWHTEHLVKSPQDYKILQWVVEHTEVLPRYEPFLAKEAELGEHGIVIVNGGRTPAMAINVDWAGTERFCLDVASEVEELFDLYEALKRLCLEEVRVAARGPGRFFKWFENLTISMLGPRRYRELLLPMYASCVPLLHEGGKRVMVHYDGALSVIREDIAAAPFDAIESLTEPPEGDMTYAQCRAAWPDKVLWANLNVELFHRPSHELRREIQARRERAGKRGFAFEISEDLPTTWRESVPVALAALREVD